MTPSNIASSGPTRITQAIVLGAGLGTRLRPLTNHLPKPGVPLFHRPVAAHAIAHLAEAGVERIAVNTHYLARELEESLSEHCPEGVTLVFNREETLLGTGGGVRGAWSKLDSTGPVFVMNGDIAFAPSLERLAAVHATHDAIATMVVRESPDAVRLGAIATDGTGRVRRLLGTPDDRDFESEYMFTGVHALSAAAFDALPSSGCIIRTAYRRWIDGDETVAAMKCTESFRDVGTLAEYLRAHLDALDEGEETAIHPQSVVHPGATITRSWVGNGATIAEGVTLDECVVWPGATVNESARRTVIGPFGTLAADD